MHRNLRIARALETLRRSKLRPGKTEKGDWFLIEPSRRWIDLNIVTWGDYEPGTKSLLDKLLDEGDCFIDVGANIGLMSIHAARRVGNGRVIAFEPDATNFARLAWAIERNGSYNVIPLKMGLGSRRQQLNIVRNSSGDGGLTSFKASETRDLVGEQVDIETLDAVLTAFQHWGPVSAIKIDVEGFEREVVDGGMETLARDRPHVIMELVDESAVAAGNVLSEIGYKAFATKGKGEAIIDELVASQVKKLTHDNMVFIHETKIDQVLQQLRIVE